VTRSASTLVRALPVLALLAGCATGRPLNMRELGARGPGEQRVLSGLKQLYTLQKTYQAQNGRFAASTDELKQVGWRDQEFGDYQPWVTDSGNRLCLAMVTSRGRHEAYSMDAEGLAYRGARCGR
jgi:hypothetical protein